MAKDYHRIHDLRIQALQEAKALYSRALMWKSIEGSSRTLSDAERYIDGARSGFGYYQKLKSEVYSNKAKLIKNGHLDMAAILNEFKLHRIFKMREAHQYDQEWMRAHQEKVKVIKILIESYPDNETLGIGRPQKSRRPLLNRHLLSTDTVHSLI